MIKGIFSAILVFFLFSQYGYASVVMNGTRIIYSGQYKEKTLHFSNKGEHPYIVQIQVDSKDHNDDDVRSDDFVVSPPVFRIESSRGQSVRLMFSGENLPQDRESLYYLNFTQIPANKPSGKDANFLILAVTNRVKLFYRPASLTNKNVNIAENLIFRQQGRRIVVENPTGYYAVIRSASITYNNRDYPLTKAEMIAPKSSTSWQLSESIPHTRGAKMSLVMVNDYGVDKKITRDF
jgi:fimbrial chaperone protein